MKKLFAIALAILLSGCVVYPYSTQYTVQHIQDVCNAGECSSTVVYETAPVVGEYYVGYWRPGFGYWTGYGWDFEFYAYGHPGYGHHYRSPRGWVYRAPRANPGVPHYRYHH